jgi:hypothetical protein
MGSIRKPKHGPEWHTQQKLIDFLEARGWLVEVMHGNAFQQGIPDLFLFHPKWDYRWVDVKHPVRYTFTKAQRRKWPIWDRYGVGIWILTAANQEEYDKLFAPPNWQQYWKDSWSLPTVGDIDRMLDELD